MSNIFKDVLNDADATQKKFLGEDYEYWKNIKTPAQLGMSDKGDLKTMAKDINGLINYVELLVTGSSKASKTGKPLGNKFFLKTGAKCLDEKNKKQDRYIYISNKPNVNIPFVSSGVGKSFKDFKGLLPSTMGTLNALNPFILLQGFMEGATPPCKKVTLETIDNKNKSKKQSHYISVTDIKNMSPCLFLDKTNPVTKKKCKDSFSNMKDPEDDGEDIGSFYIDNFDESVKLPNDPIIKIYFACLGIIGIYILYRLMNKTK